MSGTHTHTYVLYCLHANALWEASHHALRHAALFANIRKHTHHIHLSVCNTFTRIPLLPTLYAHAFYVRYHCSQRAFSVCVRLCAYYDLIIYISSTPDCMAHDRHNPLSNIGALCVCIWARCKAVYTSAGARLWHSSGRFSTPLIYCMTASPVSETYICECVYTHIHVSVCAQRPLQARVTWAACVSDLDECLGVCVCVLRLCAVAPPSLRTQLVNFSDENAALNDGADVCIVLAFTNAYNDGAINSVCF